MDGRKIFGGQQGLFGRPLSRRSTLKGLGAGGLGALASVPLAARVLFPRLTARLRRTAARWMEPPPVTRLTKDGDFKQHLQWSPDGKRFLFTRIHEGKMALWTMNADGSDLKPLLSPDP